MEEIKELEDKYLVLKWDDINCLEDRDSDGLYHALNCIEHFRMGMNKPRSNRYVVLNLDDEIDLDNFATDYKQKKSYWENDGVVKVSDIAVDLVNAILKVKKG